MPKAAPLTPAQARALAAALGRRLRRDVPLAPLTTFKIGGRAAWFYAARDADELALVVTTARQLGVGYFVLGCGANILIGDRGYAGLIIHNRADGVAFDGARLTAGSGAIMYPDVIEAAVARGLSGLEHYVGIPSTVGGALWQNLHFLSPPPERARTQFIAEVLYSADLLTVEGERKTVDAAYFNFGYDYSILHERADVVLAARFALSPAEPEKLRATMAANLAWRAQRHPPLDTQPSAGSVFRKIEGIGAGRLIDECGLKGLRVGGAQIPDIHANIIVNSGGASAADVTRLIMHTQQTVEARTGYWLEPEIGFVGDFAPVKRLVGRHRTGNARVT